MSCLLRLKIFFATFRIPFLLLTFYSSFYPTLFCQYSFLIVSCFVTQGMSVLLLYVNLLAFIFSSHFLFYFVLSPLLPTLSAPPPLLLYRHICKFVPTCRNINVRSEPLLFLPFFIAPSCFTHTSLANLLWVGL